MVISFFILGYLYYLARYKRRFNIAGIFYCVFAYLFLLLNYYLNSGINGPTIFGFLAMFILFIAVTPQPQHKIWITLHILLVLGLLYIEYSGKILIKNTYPSPADRVKDTAGSYIVFIICLYFIINNIRNKYYNEKKLAEQRATSIIRQNQELEELNQEKNRLFSLISHDLRAPLNSIQGYLELLTDTTLPEAEKFKIETQLLSLTKHTQEMLFNLLSWSKSQLSGNAVELQSLNVYKTLEGTMEMLQNAADKKGIALKNLIDEAIQIKADADMVQLVVRNLLNNAIKFTGDDGEIVIKTQRDGNNCVISIKDNGTGIPLEKQDEIFSLKIKSALGTKKEKGVGLGLFLCGQLIELQSGKIWFNSKPGIGSEFFISLPVSNN